MLYTAIVYEWVLDGIPTSEPLFGIPYIGQSVRIGSPNQVASKRWREHAQLAKKPKKIGLSFAIAEFGVDAFSKRILWWKRDTFESAQHQADAKEIELISSKGGVLRDCTKRLHQTLNLVVGGQFNPSQMKTFRDSFAMLSFRRFQSQMNSYVDRYGSANVPKSHVSPNGYKLGSQLSNLRGGCLWKEHPDYESMIGWYLGLPGATLNGKSTDEYKAMLSSRGKDRQRKLKEAGLDTLADHGRRWRDNASDEEKAAVRRTQSNARNIELDRQRGLERYNRLVEKGAALPQDHLERFRRSDARKRQLDERLACKLSVARASNKLERTKSLIVHRAVSNAVAMYKVSLLKKVRGYERARACDVAKAKREGVKLPIDPTALEELKRNTAARALERINRLIAEA